MERERGPSSFLSLPSPEEPTTGSTYRVAHKIQIWLRCSGLHNLFAGERKEEMEDREGSNQILGEASGFGFRITKPSRMDVNGMSACGE